MFDQRKMMKNLKDKTVQKQRSQVALVIGSNNQVASKAVELFAAQGMQVVVEDPLSSQNQPAGNTEKPAFPVITELKNLYRVGVFCNKLSEYKPDLIFINISGIQLEENDEASRLDPDGGVQTRLSMVKFINKACGEYMKSKGEGTIINAFTMLDLVEDSSTIWGNSKFGLRGFLKAFGIEMKQYGVQVKSKFPEIVEQAYPSTGLLRKEGAEQKVQSLSYLDERGNLDLNKLHYTHT